jgi:multicomponent Na+:H+ antiporter subunit E
MEPRSPDARPLQERPSAQHYLFVFGVLIAIWLLLVGTLHEQEVIAGVIAAFLVTLVAGPKLGIFTGIRFSLLAPVHLVLYLAYFLVALVRANLDVAWRVLSPSLPIRPGVVAVRTGLQSDLGRLILANSITLTPGTLSVDVQRDTILVHWIDCPPGVDVEQATCAIVGSFERHISGFLK